MNELPWLVAIIVTGYAGIYDLKTGLVQKEVPIFLSVFGLFYWGFVGDYFLKSLLFGLCLLGLGVFAALEGWWGGGDAFILGSLGFLLPDFSIFPPIAYILNFLLVAGLFRIVQRIYYRLSGKDSPKWIRVTFIFPVMLVLMFNQSDLLSVVIQGFSL